MPQMQGFNFLLHCELQQAPDGTKSREMPDPIAHHYSHCEELVQPRAGREERLPSAWQERAVRSAQPPCATCPSGACTERADVLYPNSFLKSLFPAVALPTHFGTCTRHCSSWAVHQGHT